MLTFIEEILLLTLDDENGSFLPIRDNTMDYVLAGAALLDLAFIYRIDTDPDRLMLIDRTPPGIPMLDRVLERIAGSAEDRTTRDWVETLAREEAEDLREAALARLVEQGILETQDKKFLWVFRARRYPAIDGTVQREVKHRIADVLLSDEVPDPRDVAIISLADSCAILRSIFSDHGMDSLRPRIDQVRKLDLIGREVADTIEEIERTMAMAMARIPH